MSKIKIKQIDSANAPEGAVLTVDAEGKNVWALPTASSSLLGIPDDGSLTDSRYQGGKPPAVGLTATTKVVTAIDSINEVLGLLLPNPPAALSQKTLSLSTSSTALAAQGYTTNGLANAPAAGASVSRVTSATVSTNTIDDAGDGMDGVLTAVHNGVDQDYFTLTSSVGQTKNSGILRVTDNKWSGTASGGGAAPEGFFQSFDANITGQAVVVGLNTLQLKHSISGDTNVVTFVRDDLTSNPVVSGVSVAENTKAGVKSSGIEHYGPGSTLNVDANIINLAGETYKSGTIVSMTGPGSTVNFTAGQAGLPSILPTDMAPFDMADQVFTIGGNNKTISGKVTVQGSNPNGNGSASHSENLLVLSGSGGLNDSEIYGGVTASRVFLSNGLGDTPSDLSYSGWASIWDLSVAGYRHEAAIVGGVLRCDRTNYSVGYLPAGNPDYSVKDADQYVTYRLAVPAKSSINVSITGSYSGLWVALPGISDDAAQSPNAEGGAWWDATELYNGAGVPGRAGQTAGCADGAVASGSSGTVKITFGTASSTNSTGNAIFIRIKLTAGQSITALSVA